MSFAKDYDLDNTNYPAQVILTVCCVDDEQDAPLSGCTQITVTITVSHNYPFGPQISYIELAACKTLTSQKHPTVIFLSVNAK